MAGSLNKVILIGSIGKDFEVRKTAQPFARFGLTTTETLYSQTGERQQRAESHNVVAWGKQAEVAERCLRPGRLVMIEGRVQYRDDTDQQTGVKRWYTDVRCDNFVALSRADDDSSQGGGQQEGEDPTPSLNKVILIGNLGKDPEIKMFPSGQPLARFSLATTETWKSQTGERLQKAEWHNVVVWGNQVEIAEKYLRKGKQVMIEGRIQYRDYTDQSGIKRTYTDIRCDNFVMLGRADEGPRQGGGSYERQGGSYDRQGGSYERQGGGPYDRQGGGPYERQGGGPYARQGGGPSSPGYEASAPPPQSGGGGSDDDVPF
jgi:single-strand DNA-binding protein